MNELISFLIGMAGVAAGVTASWLIPGRRRQPQIKAICGCGHRLAYHDVANGQCHGRVEIVTHYNAYGEEVAWGTEQCTCRQYDGPTPLPTVYAPELS
ncbi:hypothetical protein ACIBG7_12355 [Nonomuraea sp. NPDC050328]|uniref:hypothetical protein n=1 Tax=Nonomuraea sp. NPDC050328 TaxID=3364361 RepID=UPI0037A42430